MDAMILVGGLGSRLDPLTETRPKPLIHVVNAPMLDAIIRHLAEEGFDRITLLTGYMGDTLRRYANTGHRWGVSIHYIQESQQLGTAGAVLHALSQMPLRDPFLVVSGDGLTDASFSDFYQQCKSQQAHAGLLLVHSDTPNLYGVVEIDANGNIVSFNEKPSVAQADAWINAGIYYLDPRQLAGLPQGIPLDFGREVFPRWVTERRPLIGVTSSGYWTDVGTLAAYRQAIEDILRGKVSVPGINLLPTDLQTDPAIHIIPPVYIDPSACIESGALIGPYTVVGPDTFVGNHAILSHTIIRANTRIAARAHLEGALVAEGSTIEADAELAPGVVVGENSHVFQGVHLLQGIHVPAFTEWLPQNSEASSSRTLHTPRRVNQAAL